MAQLGQKSWHDRIHGTRSGPYSEASLTHQPDLMHRTAHIHTKNTYPSMIRGKVSWSQGFDVSFSDKKFTVKERSLVFRKIGSMQNFYFLISLLLNMIQKASFNNFVSRNHW